MDFTFNIVQSRQQITLMLDGGLLLGDVAGYLNEEKYTQSLNIGIYSQNKQYYTENKDEKLLTIGTGEGDTYLILEGHEKNKYKNTQEIKLNSNSNQQQQQQQQQKQQQQQEEGQGQEQDIQALDIIIVDGLLIKIFQLTLNLSTATLNDIKFSVEQFLGLSSKYSAADIYINDIWYNRQDKLTKPLKMLNISKTTPIHAKVRFFGGFLLVINDELP